jgi:hypothetical protein
MSMRVALGYEDALRGARVGVGRTIDDMYHGRNHRIPTKMDDFRGDIIWACAELAVANLLGVEWHPGGYSQRLEGDVGRIEVRGTTRNGDGPLYIGRMLSGTRRMCLWRTTPYGKSSVSKSSAGSTLATPCGLTGSARLRTVIRCTGHHGRRCYPSRSSPSGG